jgi:Bacterial SH3 domain
MPVGGDGLQHELGESYWDLDTERQGSQPTGKLVAIAVAATLAIGMLAYFLSPSGQEKSTAQSPSEQPNPTTRPSSPPETRETQSLNPRPPAPDMADWSSAPAEPSYRPAAPPTVTWPDPPALPVQPGPNVGQPLDIVPTASPLNTAANPPPTQDTVLFLQRPGVNIREAPSPTGKVVGTAPRGTRFQVTNRKDEWVEVENGRLKGWISGRFLRPEEPAAN